MKTIRTQSFSMNKLAEYFRVLLLMIMSVGLTSCTSVDNIPETEFPPQDPNTTPSSDTVKITIGSTTFTATLASNSTATAFKELLPMTIRMSELNNNEKYYNLPKSLPTNASNPGTIRNGDLMLYGSDTFVLFYKTFSTSYRYTRIGSVDNPSGLQSALGEGSITVKFELQE